MDKIEKINTVIRVLSWITFLLLAAETIMAAKCELGFSPEEKVKAILVCLTLFTGFTFILLRFHKK